MFDVQIERNARNFINMFQSPFFQLWQCRLWKKKIFLGERSRWPSWRQPGHPIYQVTGSPSENNTVKQQTRAKPNRPLTSNIDYTSALPLPDFNQRKVFLFGELKKIEIKGITFFNLKKKRKMSEVISVFQTQFPTLITYCTLIPSNYSTVLASNCLRIRRAQTSKGNLCNPHTYTEDRESASATVAQHEIKPLNCLIGLTFRDDTGPTQV